MRAAEYADRAEATFVAVEWARGELANQVGGVEWDGHDKGGGQKGANYAAFGAAQKIRYPRPSLLNSPSE